MLKYLDKIFELNPRNDDKNCNANHAPVCVRSQLFMSTCCDCQTRLFLVLMRCGVWSNYRSPP
jgi:hypothetical protein